MSGRLFIIATPIGNLQDLTFRTKTVLNDCQLILAEDTRVSIKLLNHLALKKPLLSCHEFNENKRLGLLKDVSAEDGAIALVCDAGTPLVSDPGYRIVQEALSLGMQVIPIPGPSAFLLALVGSGLACDRFIFEGFLPDKKGERTKHLNSLLNEERTLIFYVSPHDLMATLAEMLAAFGDRPACLARELTKLHEEFLRGTLAELHGRIKDNKVRGECVLVIAGNKNKAAPEVTAEQITRELEDLLAQGEHLKDISSNLAKKYGWPKSDIYKLGITCLERKRL